MWLGGSLAAIDENSFLACAPRWATQKNKDRAVHGFCYRAQTGNGNVQGLEPPLQYWDQLTNSGTLIWFYGQTGFSSAVDHSKTLMLAGAPGYLGWRGNAILYNLDEMSQLQSCQPASQFNTVFKVNSRRGTSGDSADYFGYHVASGQNSFGQATIFGVGAPRGNGEKDRHLAGFASLISVTRRNIHGAPLMGIHDVVLGEQLGSYFGAVVAFVDVNGNGEDEMFVGAPFYTVGHSSESYDEGCVFVYSKSILVEKLCPSSESGSRFGSAIASLGDIDHDGFIDVAIGSPGSANRRGEVYIYYGHPNFPNSRESSPQIIRAPEINDNNFKGFGSTLFGNIDLDKNGTPDLLIGAASTNQIVIYRTRPRLKLQPVVTNFQMRADSLAIYKLKREDLSFRLLFCISSQIQPKNDGKLEIQVEAKFDSSEERYQFNNKLKILKFSLQVTTNAAPNCTNVHVNRVKEVEIQNPASIKIGWKMSYNNTISEIFEISKLSVTSNAQGRHSLGDAIFCTWCPKSMEQFHDHFLPVAIDNCDEDGNEICNSKLKVVASLRPINGIDNDKLNEYTIGPHGPRFLDVYIENHGETAYSPNVVVNVSFSNPTLSNSFIIRPTLDGNHKCYLNNNKVVCRDPLHKGQKEHLSFIITISQTLAALKNEETIEIIITAYPGPYPEQMEMSNPVKFKLISDVKLTLTALNAERKDISINDANAVFRSSYEIINSGLSPVNNLHFKFQIPVTYVRNDEEQQAVIVYMPKPYNRISCVPPNSQGFPPLPAIDIKNTPPLMDFPNATNDEVTPNIGISRRRRQTQNERGQTDVRKSVTGNNNNNAMLDVDCVTVPQWKCVDVVCSLTSPLLFREPLIIELILKFSKNATNNNNIIPSESTVLVTTFAKVWTFDDNFNPLNASAVTVLQSESYGDLPAYLIFVSGIGGLIIFLLIAFLMFKCGFFRRKTKENLANLKAQAEQADLLAENFHIPPDDPNDE
ncbi:integrin alpha-PS3 [Folsomia candida]|uniref:integrin alpha-PS3 n=1 Tax=Folsomia candida TaxID=158441 RepID=UPI00160519C4|nr:integrin alpha-PS3 [Folsomia candida]